MVSPPEFLRYPFSDQSFDWWPEYLQRKRVEAREARLDSETGRDALMANPRVQAMSQRIKSLGAHE